MLQKDRITAFPSLDYVTCAEVHADALGGVIRPVKSAVEPPGSMVVLEMMVRPRSFLAAGKDWGGGCDHGMSCVGITTSRSPGRNERPS